MGRGELAGRAAGTFSMSGTHRCLASSPTTLPHVNKCDRSAFPSFVPSSLVGNAGTKSSISMRRGAPLRKSRTAYLQLSSARVWGGGAWRHYLPDGLRRGTPFSFCGKILHVIKRVPKRASQAAQAMKELITEQFMRENPCLIRRPSSLGERMHASGSFDARTHSMHSPAQAMVSSGKPLGSVKDSPLNRSSAVSPSRTISNLRLA